MKFCEACFYTLDIKKAAGIKKEDITVINEPNKFIDIYKNNDKLDKIQLLFTIEDLEKHLKQSSFSIDKQKDIIEQFNKYKKFTSNYYYICTNCENTYDLEPNTLLYTFNFGIGSNTINQNKTIKLTDPILPRTKEYICPNKKCTSHKDLENKEAIWYRSQHNQYNIEYICCTCREKWIIS